MLLGTWQREEKETCPHIPSKDFYLNHESLHDTKMAGVIPRPENSSGRGGPANKAPGAGATEILAMLRERERQREKKNI